MANAVEPRSDMPTLGTLSYDGHDFENGTKTVGIKITPEPNASGTAVKYTRYVFTFETMLGGGPTGEPVTELRRLLSRQGRPFTYNDRGLGRFFVNAAGSSSVKDVFHGPKVREVDFRVLGGANACVLTWSLETCIPDCEDAKSEMALIELETVVTYTVDFAGYTTRTVTGHLTIPNRVVNRHFVDNPDDYLESVIPPPLYGFQRTFAPRTISADRTRLDFGYTDTEVLEPPPDFVADWDFDEAVSSSTAGFAVWSANINATYEFTRDMPSNVVPWRHFFLLCDSRVKTIAGQIGTKAKSIVPVHFSMRRPKGAKRRIVTFSFACTFSASLGDVLSSGLTWQPVPGTDWRKWALSLRNSAFNPRGYAQLRFDVGDEEVVTLCTPQSTKKAVAGSLDGELRGSPFQLGGRGPTNDDIRRAIDAIGSKPQIGTSWLYYENEVFVEMESGNSLVRTLPTKELTAADELLGKAVGIAGPAVDAASNAGKLILQTVVAPVRAALGGGLLGGVFQSPAAGAVAGGANQLRSKVGEDGTQRRAKGSCYVYLRGRAARAGYQIPVPVLGEAAGQVPVEANRLDRGEGFAQVERFGAGSTTVFIATWNIRYFLPRTPARDEVIKVPQNPMLLPDPT